MGKQSLSALLVLVMVMCFSSIAIGQQPAYRNYLVLKGGALDPQGDLKDLDTGFNGELAYGIQLGRWFALEIASGYFELEGKERASFSGSDFSLDGNMYAIPLTIALKPILPVGPFDFYGLAGGGGYYVHADGTLATRSGRISGSADTAVGGGFLGAGLSLNLSKQFFLGVEGKYLWTSKTDFDVHNGEEISKADFKIEGIQGTFNMGFRF